MRVKSLFGLTLAVIVCTSALAPAQRPRRGRPAAARLNVFSLRAYAVEPNIEAILNVTPEQREKLDKAAQETTRAPKLVELQPKRGQRPDRAKRQEYAQEFGKARAELKKRTDEILTAEQKATIQKVDDALKNALDSALTKEQKEKLDSLKKAQPRRKNKRQKTS